MVRFPDDGLEIAPLLIVRPTVLGRMVIEFGWMGTLVIVGLTKAVGYSSKWMLLLAREATVRNPVHGRNLGCMRGSINRPCLLSPSAQVFCSICGLASSALSPPSTETTVLDLAEDCADKQAAHDWLRRRTRRGLADTSCFAWWCWSCISPYLLWTGTVARHTK